MRVTNNSPTILAVNDTPEILDILAVMLKREGYSLATADNGRKALDLAFSINPDLIISDVVMPEMDGLEFCRQLKQDQRTTHIPILLVSAVRTEEEDSIGGLLAGADDYLFIPFRSQELLIKVAKLIERHRIERHYRELVEFSPEIILTRDMNGNINSINEAGSRFFGMHSTELIGKNIRDLVGAEEAKKSFEATKKLENGKPLRVLYQLPDAQGMMREQEAILMLITDAKGQAVGVRSVIRDITERKLAKDLLRESEGKYRELVENLTDVLYTTDKIGAFTYVSPATQSLTGYKPSQLLGSSYFNLVHPEDEEEVRRYFERVKSGESSIFEYRWLRENQEVRWVRSSDRAILREGKFVGWRGLVTDITEQKSAEEALRRSEESYRELIENANDLIYTHDLQGNFTSLNKAGERITGYSCEEAMRMNIADLIVPEDLDMAKKMIARKTSKNDSTTYELLIITKSGERAALEVSTQLVYENGKPVAVQGIGRDITERRRTEEALRNSEERFFKAFNASPDPMTISRYDDGSYIYVNDSYLASTGYEEHEIIGRNTYELGLWAKPEDSARLTRLLAEQGQIVKEEVQFCLKSGEVRTGIFSAEVITVGGEKCILTHTNDITVRKQMDDALHKEREFLKAVLNNIEEGVIACNEEGVLTLANRAAKENYGFPDLPVSNENWAKTYTLYKPDGKELMQPIETPLFRAFQGERVDNAEMIIEVRNENRKHRVLASGQALFDTSEKKIGAVIALNDTTERVEAENRLLASVQQLETLTALATAVKDVNELNRLLKGLADAITNLTDYRTCLVLLLTDEVPHHPHIVSASSNIPKDFLLRVSKGTYQRSVIQSVTEEGVKIGVGELGFAAYYPPGHYDTLERNVPNRYKTKLPMPEVSNAQIWHAGDELHVPLITHDGEYMGYISLDDPRSGRAPDRQSVLPVVALARQVVQLLAQQKASEASAQQVEREAILNRISNAVRQSLDIKEVFRTAVNELGLYLNVDRCTLYLHDEEAGVVRNVAEYHVPGVVSARTEFAYSAISDLANEINKQGVIAIDNTEKDPRVSKYYDIMLRPAGTRSIMWVAIKLGDETPATFAISTTSSHRSWSKADIELAMAVANQTGIAIRQAKLYQKAETTSEREALINRLSLTIRASLRLPEILSAATRELGRALSASRVYLRLHKSGNESPPIANEYIAPYAYSIKRLQITNYDPVGQFLIRQTQTLVINDVRNFNEGSDEFNRYIKEWAQTTETFSSINCPLVVNGRFRGTLCIDQTDRVRYWNEDEAALVEAVASQLATGIAQAELFEMTKRAKKEWEATFNAMSDGIFIFDSKGLLIRVNRAGAAMEDSWPHLLMGRRCCDILRASPEENTCIVERAIAEGKSVTVEITPEGLNRPLVISAEPLVDSETGTVGVVCTARDFSELRKLEAEARENQLLLTNILESVRETICAIDTKGRILWSNSAAFSIMGYSPDEIIGKHFLDLIFIGDRDYSKECFDDALLGAPRSYEARFVTSEGEVRYALFDNAPLVQDDRTTGVLWIARDITEQKQQRAKAAQADKLRALGQLASGVAHDFNNALAAILGRTQLMTRTVTDKGFKRNLEIIQTAAEDAAATVRRIQTFARQPTGKQFELLNVAGLLRDSIEITRTRWENEALMSGRNIEVELDAEGEFYTEGSASELREVFVNLIVNAVDAMPKGGRMLISCYEFSDNIVLRFTDTGTGMSDEIRERIFEPFYTTKGIQGTGLGLAVSYSIIESHSGSINVISEPNKGTTFEIELPKGEHTMGTVSEVQTQIEMPSLNVLVIDDEDFVRETLADMLDALGHTVIAVDSGQSAFEIMSKQRFDLVFTDLSMPEVDGWDVANVIRNRWANTNIVMVTGYGAGVQSPNGEENLIDGVIGKPFDFDQVSETIAQVTMKPRRTRIAIDTAHDDSAMIH